MQARITGAFRIREGAETVKYTAGQVAEGETAKWAVDNGFAVPVAAEAKAKAAPKNKAAAPKADK